MENPARLTSDSARDDLLDAAQGIFAVRGFDAASLRDVTERAGVAHGMVRHHFRSKEGLWQAVVDRAVGRYRDALAPHAERAAAGDPPGTRAASRAAVRSFLQVNALHPDLLRLTLYEGVRGGCRLEYLLQRYAPVAALMEPLFKQAQQAGFLRQFDQRAFLMFLLTAGAMPFALPGLSTGLLGSPLEPGTNHTERHINRILDTLYGPETVPLPGEGADRG
ncbi:TetR/AcrR family transcriptional regulator [Streptomyces sp. YIM S03343]